MRRFLLALLVAALSSAQAAAQQSYAIPVKMWVYGLDKAPQPDDIRRTIQNLNSLYASNGTGLSFYLEDVEYVRKKKFDSFGFYGQMPWQSVTRHTKGLLNISLVPELRKGGKPDSYTGVCFTPTGSVVVARGEDPSVIAHEVGHALGLSHALDIPDNIMSYNPVKSARRKFTDSQKTEMLKNAARMKNSQKMAVSEGEPLADAMEPDFCKELSVPAKLGVKCARSFHKSVNKKGEASFAGRDYFKISFKSKELPRQVFLAFKESGKGSHEASILIENSKGEQVASLHKTGKSEVFPLWILQADTYYIVVDNLSQEAWEYSLTLEPENLGNK